MHIRRLHNGACPSGDNGVRCPHSTPSLLRGALAPRLRPGRRCSGSRFIRLPPSGGGSACGARTRSGSARSPRRRSRVDLQGAAAVGRVRGGAGRHRHRRGPDDRLRRDAAHLAPAAVDQDPVRAARAGAGSPPGEDSSPRARTPWVRHPRYLEILVGFLGWALFCNYLAAYLVWAFLVVALLILIPMEERELVQRFGPAYEEYRRRVPALIPRLRRLRVTTERASKHSASQTPSMPSALSAVSALARAARPSRTP